MLVIPTLFLTIKYMNIAYIVGGLAIILMNGSAIPQLVKTIKTKKSRDLTLGREIMLLCGCLLYLAYGIFRKDPIIIISNTWAGTMFILLIYYIKKHR